MKTRDSLWYSWNRETDEILPIDSPPAGKDLFATRGARQVAEYRNNGVMVSTVFLGCIHLYDMLFETMIFGGPKHDYQWRYKTPFEARAGHDAIVEWVQLGYPDPEPIYAEWNGPSA